MSETPQPSQPEQPADAGPATDPQTGEDLSWRQTAMSAVLLDRSAPDHREIGELLTEIFEGSFEVEHGTGDDPATAVYIADATVIVTSVDAPIPDGQIGRDTSE